MPSLGGRAMGSDIEARAEPLKLAVRVVAEAPIETIDIVRSRSAVETIAASGREEFELHREIGDLVPGEYLYVRVVQADGGAAWSSPFFIR